jgi:putative nucleotide binding protein
MKGIKMIDQKKIQKSKEENVIVLDFLPHGNSQTKKSFKQIPLIQAIGTNRFSLLEIVPKPDVQVMPGDILYVGEGKRDKVHHISGKLDYEKLTGNSQQELTYAVEKIVGDNEKNFVEFYNKAQAIGLRRHALELLPGLGKRYMWDIIEEREEKEFESFDNIKERIKAIPSPKQAIIKRIIHELKEEEKFYLFVDK